MTSLPFAISPCPNDTFLFYPWILGFFDSPLLPEPHYKDIQTLNEEAKKGNFPLIKISYACLKKVFNQYEMLDIGSALGHNCGPKLIAKESTPLSGISEKRIAIPGEDTTAHLLFQTFFPNAKNKRFCFYHEVESLILKGEVDAGVIIHETRFTFQKQGLKALLDLGERWEETKNLSIPLGGLAIRRDLSDELKDQIYQTLKKSLKLAYERIEDGMPYILKHSQDKTSEVLQSHIDLYVNKESQKLSEKGKEAVNALLGLKTEDWLYENSAIGASQ